MERNTKIPNNENRSKREGSTEKYKQHEWAKGTLTLFIDCQGKACQQRKFLTESKWDSNRKS
jgi:hypothetical protein